MICTNDRYIAAGGADEKIYLLDFYKGKNLGFSLGHKSSILSLHFCKPRYLISASINSNIKVWNVPNLELIHTMKYKE